jgi:hypothetical protein
MIQSPVWRHHESMTAHPSPSGVDQSLRFTLSDLDGRYYWLDGVLYANTDHHGAAELRAAQSLMPAINQAAFDRLQELTETNRRMRSELRECADAYQRGYTQGLADAAASVMESATDEGGNRTQGAGV